MIWRTSRPTLFNVYCGCASDKLHANNKMYHLRVSTMNRKHTKRIVHALVAMLATDMSATSCGCALSPPHRMLVPRHAMHWCHCSGTCFGHMRVCLYAVWHVWHMLRGPGDRSGHILASVLMLAAVNMRYTSLFEPIYEEVATRVTCERNAHRECRSVCSCNRPEQIAATVPTFFRAIPTFEFVHWKYNACLRLQLSAQIRELVLLGIKRQNLAETTMHTHASILTSPLHVGKLTSERTKRDTSKSASAVYEVWSYF